MTRKPVTINFWTGRLPHWEVEDGRYFVTIHLSGAIPPAGQQRLHALRLEGDRQSRADSQPWLRTQRKIFAEMESWLDTASPARQLQQPNIAAIVAEAIAYRDGRDWRMYEYTIMPSHVHLFFEIVGHSSAEESHLKQVLEQFKRWTGHAAGKVLHADGDRFWQDEWFDHWSRSDSEDERIIAYIRENPVKAGLIADYRQWPYRSKK